MTLPHALELLRYWNSVAEAEVRAAGGSAPAAAEPVRSLSENEMRVLAAQFNAR